MPSIFKGFDYSGLSAAERIQLAQELWDSVYEQASIAPLSSEQRERLDRRRTELESGIVTALTRDELR